MKTKVKVEQMTSRNGNKIANQFIIHTNKGRFFQSYKSIIAFINKENKVFLDDYFWNYSRTTSKYRNDFLNENTQETRKRIESKEYKLMNLNK